MTGTARSPIITWRTWLRPPCPIRFGAAFVLTGNTILSGTGSRPATAVAADTYVKQQQPLETFCSRVPQQMIIDMEEREPSLPLVSRRLSPLLALAPSLPALSVLAATPCGVFNVVQSSTLNRGLSGSRGHVTRFATLWLLSGRLVLANDHQSTLSQRTDLINSTPPAGASVAEGEQQQVSIFSPRKKDSQQLEVDIAEIPPPVAAPGPLSNATFPSARCANREEWQGTCRLWSGEPHNRYLEFGKIESREGIGANLGRIAWALRHVISFDLEPVITGPLIVGHGTGEFGDWMGLAHNPMLTIQDQAAFEKAKHQSVPFPDGNNDDWFLEQENRTSVVFSANPTKVLRMTDWSSPVSPPSSDSRVCRYMRQALRNIYWSVPQNRGRCDGLLPDDHYTPPETGVSPPPGHDQKNNRPWVVAVHVRRGDIITFRNGSRSLSHKYYQATATSVLRGIADTNPAAHVSVLVFSEGPDTLNGLQLMDEHGEAVTWNIVQESCLDIGLICSQRVHLNTTAFETFDCLAAADVVVGSRSSFSDTAGAVSTNVKIMTREYKTEQDRLTVNPRRIESSGAVSSDEQLQMNAAIANWWHCSVEARGSEGSTVENLDARGFYQTVGEELP